MEPGGQPRGLAAHGVAMERALRCGLVERADGIAQLPLCGGGIGRDSLGRLFHCSANIGTIRAVALRALEILSMALLRRRMIRNMRHSLS